jgi:hypothetical protein
MQRLASLLAIIACACASEAASQAGAPLTSNAGLYRVTIFPEPDPAQVGENSLRLAIEDDGGAPVLDATLAAFCWMPAHGHPAPREPLTIDEGRGDYRIEPLDYSMPGHWSVDIDVNSGGAHDAFTVGIDVR